MLQKKKSRLIAGIIVSFILLILILIPVIAKLYINKNGEKLIGRKIELHSLKINYFRTRITLKDFVLYEANKKDTFVSFSEFSVNLSPWKLIHKELSFSDITLLNAYVNLEQRDTIFNFTDIMEFTAQNSAPAEEEVSPVDTSHTAFQYSIDHFNLSNTEVKYTDLSINNVIDLHPINLNLQDLAWNGHNAQLNLNFIVNNKGKVSIATALNNISGTYNVQLNINDLQLISFANYLKSNLNVSDFNAFLNTDININGNTNHPEYVIVKGNISLDSLHLVDSHKNELISFESFKVDIDKADIEKQQYFINHIKIEHPKISLIVGKEQTNVEYILEPSMKQDSTTTPPTDTLQTTPNDSTITPVFKLQNFTYNDGQINLIDSTLNRLFKYKIQHININTDNIDSDNKVLDIDYTMSFPNKGKLNGTAKIDFENGKNLNVDGHIEHLDLHDFSPYTEYYLGYPILSGYLYYDCTIQMEPTHLDNRNHILVKKIEFGPSNSDIDTTKVPIKLAMVVLKDRHGNVEVNIPIKGDPSDPNFSLVKIMLGTLTKFTFKAATSPLKILRSILLGSNTKNLSYIPFEYTQDSLQHKQRQTLDDVAKILEKKPELSFTFRQDIAINQEIDMLAAKKVKAKYITDKKINKEWDKIKDDDKDFLRYLNKISPDTKGQEPSDRYLKISAPKDKLMNELKTLYTQRNQGILDYLIQKKGCDSSSVHIQLLNPETLPQKLDIPGFEVEVSAK